MLEMIISLMNTFGYIGILLLILLENIFPPIPSEVILCFGGFMTTSTTLTIVGVIIFSTLGSVLGAIILYYIGRILNKEKLIKIVSGRIGRILRFKKKDIEIADKWFDKNGSITVFFCRFIPIVRSLISIPAGMSEMPIIKFLIFTTLGTLLWNSILTILGSIMGENWGVIVNIIDNYASVVLMLLVIIFIVVIYLFYRKRK